MSFIIFTIPAICFARYAETFYHGYIVIQRRGHEDMALLPADELSSLRETAYLLRSPENAARLLAALARGRRGRGKRRDLASLRHELLGAP